MTYTRLNQLSALPKWGAEEIKEIQKFLGFTNQGLADLVEVNLRTVELWRQGKNPVSGPAKALLCLLGYFKVKIEEIEGNGLSI